MVSESILYVATMVVSVAICAIVFILQMQSEPRMKVSNRDSSFRRFLMKNNIRALDYDTTNAFLKSNGLLDAYSFMNPLSYTLCRIFFGGILTGIGYYAATSFEFKYPWMSLILLPVGFLLGNKIVLQMNRSDNDKMLPDIRRIYDTMRLQAKAGMFLTESLMEAYRVVRYKRLKKALLELNGSLYMTNQIVEGIDEFAGKFNNEYINMLCITIKQAEQSGQSVKVLNDISNQLVAVEKQVQKKEESALERKLLIVQLLVFGTILCITIVMLAEVLTSSLNF